ncbi:MAG TPA: NAD(P)H-hydrate dehydratase [Geminicoccaceae bacterium]|nr:NAD(P)H-hydrate dehydratase [Geminicoccaceae bacterium]
MTAPLPDDGLILTVAEMYAADRATIAGGVPGIGLMEAAGAAVADAIVARFLPRPVAVLCGPGNNGGDGFVVARLLRDAGWPVGLALLGDRARLRGDAAEAAARWRGPVEVLGPEAIRGAGLVVDALFGAGLDRPVEGTAGAVLDAVAAAGLPVVAVDVPSGLAGDTGEILGTACRADATVTFCRPKPGHLLLPGRLYVGELVVADIGIPDRVVESLGAGLTVNGPGRWLHLLPRRTPLAHKYTHGHAVVVGGGTASAGAARLAARAALRAGAGLVTVACPDEALPVYAAGLTAVMVRPFGDQEDYERLLADPRRNAVLLGPGGGVGEGLRRRVLAALAGGKACVLDADALTSFADHRAALFDAIRGPCILTPHAGEFPRLFDHRGDKVGRARAAAREGGAVVVIKGADSVIAAPDGRAAIQPDAPPELATAGTGDVLAGFALGLLAQGMPTFEAAAAAVWLHAAAGRAIGPGLIAEDLSEALPGVLGALLGGRGGGAPPGPPEHGPGRST